MNELTTVDKQTGELVEPGRQSEAEIVGMVKAFMDEKEKKITFNGKRYAEYEDWQYAAGFFGLRVKTLDPQFVEINGTKGFRAKAVVIDKNGLEVGSAESFCMMDEPNWKAKPLFQLSSMAQTRAGAKALSNIFRPLMRLAGIEGTPSEELTGQEFKPSVQMPKAKEVTPKIEDVRTTGAAVWPDEANESQVVEKVQKAMGGMASEKQRKMIFAKCRAAGISEDDLKAFIRDKFKIETTKDLRWQDIDEVLKFVDQVPPNVD